MHHFKRKRSIGFGRMWTEGNNEVMNDVDLRYKS